MKTQSGKFRIISGENRGRVLPFPGIIGLRPTPQRIRETLFNWLMPYIAGTACIDCFAGSGALGFEAVSRGAQGVVFIESNRIAADSIKNNIKTLKLDCAHVINQDSARYLKRCNQQYDILFLDPPFNSPLLQKSIELIKNKSLVKESGWIYVEFSAHQSLPDCPANWQLFRQAQAGDVKACLFRNQSGDTDQ